MKTLILILLSATLTAQVPKDWQQFKAKADSCYLLTLPTSNGDYYFGCKEKQVQQVKDMQFWYDTKQFLFFKPRKVIKIKVILY